MILFWGLKKFPLRREIPTLKDHLTLMDSLDDFLDGVDYVVLLQLTLLVIFGPREFKGYGKTLA